MATVPVEAVGGIIKAADYNFLVGGSAGQRPSFQARQTAVQSVANAGFPAMVLNVADRDTDAGLTLGTGTYTVATAGGFLLVATAQFASSAAGNRGIAIVASNGATAANFMSAATDPSSIGRLSCSLFTFLGVAQTVQVLVYQNSGGALNTSGDAKCLFSGIWIGT